MKNLPNLLVAITLLLTAITTQAQTIVVQPYLQDASPNSIRMMWETSAGEESLVLWGPDEDLGNTTSGNSFSSVGAAMMHDVQLTGSGAIHHVLLSSCHGAGSF